MEMIVIVLYNAKKFRPISFGKHWTVGQVKKRLTLPLPTYHVIKKRPILSPFPPTIRQHEFNLRQDLIRNPIAHSTGDFASQI